MSISGRSVIRDGRPADLGETRPGRGVRAAVTATTDVAPAVGALGRGGERRAGGGHVVDDKHPSRDDAVPGVELRAGATGHRRSSGLRRSPPPSQQRTRRGPPSSLATARASISAWSSPRACRRGVVAGAHVDHVDRARRQHDGRAIASRASGDGARVRRYLTRATSSRATPVVRERRHPPVDARRWRRRAAPSRSEPRTADTRFARAAAPGHDAGNAAST